MNRFSSSLVFSGKRFPKVHHVFRPRYNKEFFKRLIANLKNLDGHIKTRCKNPKEILDDVHFKTLKEDSVDLMKLKDAFAKCEKNQSEEGKNSLEKIIAKLEPIEERIMPIAVAIPNRSSKEVPQSEVVVQKLESNFALSQNLTKILSHTKLSYINNCYSKSVVGPNSHYYTGIGAKLQYGIADYFAAKLEGRNFIHTSGLCLTKSAVVEAANSKDLKNYMYDPCRILDTKPHQYTALHLVEASREAMLAYVTLLDSNVADNVLKLMSAGAGYRNGSMWFDSDEKRVTQFQTLHALILTSSIEPHSMKEFRDTKDFLWNMYTALGLPSRLVHCSTSSLNSNEYDAYRIELWLPSRQEWLPAARVSHYLDYLTIRTGMRRGHIIDSTIYDGQVLVASIIENNQTYTGRFIIPPVIKEHMIHLTDSERASYFHDAKLYNSSSRLVNLSNVSGVMNNYEQRRYLVKKSYAFSHSEKVVRNHGRFERNYSMFMLLGGTLMFGYMIDWEEVYIQFVPKPAKRYLYDKIYRPIRRYWWNLTYPDDVSIPKDLPFDETDTSLYDVHEADRKKILLTQYTPKLEKEYYKVD